MDVKIKVPEVSVISRRFMRSRSTKQLVGEDGSECSEGEINHGKVPTTRSFALKEIGEAHVKIARKCNRMTSRRA